MCCTAFDAYKKENGSDKKLPRISELNAEYAMLLERKKSSYAEYRETKSEMQDWLVAQKIVQEILKEDEQKIEQLHEQEVRQEEENRQSSRWWNVRCSVGIMLILHRTFFFGRNCR